MQGPGKLADDTPSLRATRNARIEGFHARRRPKGSLRCGEL